MTEGNGKDHLITTIGAARSALRRRLSAREGEGDRPHHAGLSQADRGGAVLCAGLVGAGRARLLAARRSQRLRARAGREDAARPDRRGNNRIDTLRNIIHDPRVALLFLIPGCSETIRVMGRASISADPALAQQFVMEGKAPRTVLVVAVEAVFYQCAKAIVRSKLWDASRHVDRKTLPTAGSILAELTGGKLGGAEHDRTAPERLKATIYCDRAADRGLRAGQSTSVKHLALPAAGVEPLLHVQRRRRHRA